MSNCGLCSGSGRCTACKGSGQSEFFLKASIASARKACPWCKAPGSWRSCNGTGQVLDEGYLFQPSIYVLTSLQIPTSISTAAITGAFWRHLDIPKRVLRRSLEAQRGWVSWRVKVHFKEKGGKCFLFGDIVGYKWFRSKGEQVWLNVHGNLLYASDDVIRPNVRS
jgi:hypothetical protein